jgi:hypothetical protein
LTDSYSSVGPSDGTLGPNPFEIDAFTGYVMTKDKNYLNLAVMGDESLSSANANGPMLNLIAAKQVATNPSLAYALTKDPMLPLAAEYAADPALAVAATVNNPRPINPTNVLLSQFIKPSSPEATLALTGSPILAHAQKTGNKLPMYLALTGQQDQATGYVAASMGEPLLVQGLTGDRQAMYAASTNDPTLSYTAQQMNSPALAYAMTKDPILAIQKPKPDDGNDRPVNPVLSYLAAKKGDPNLAFALTGDATAAYASTLPNPGKAALASAVSDQPIMTHLLTKDPVLTLNSIAETAPDTPGLAYMAAKTGDPAMALALTQDPAVAYAAQTSKPGLAALGAQTQSPAIAYLATKDPVMMAMASDNQNLKNLAGVMSGKPLLAYAVSDGNIGNMIAAKHPKPLLAAATMNSGSPLMTYALTKDPTLTILSGENSGIAGDPVDFGNLDLNLGSGSGLNLDLNLDMSGVQDAVGANPGLEYLAATSGSPLKALALTGNPAVAIAAQHSNPLLAMTATQTNPATTYLLTKDPVLTMVTAAMGGNEEPAEPRPHDPIATLVTSKVPSLAASPGLATAVTGDPNMLLTGQWGNSQLALASSMANGVPASTNPMMDLVAAHKVTDPTMAYALTGNPLLASAVATGNGKDIAKLSLGAQMGNPLLTYALTKNPAHAYISMQQNPLLSYTALQQSPVLAAVATGDPMMVLLNKFNTP